MRIQIVQHIYLYHDSATSSGCIDLFDYEGYLMKRVFDICISLPTTAMPTNNPTSDPTSDPTIYPSDNHIFSPTDNPTSLPTSARLALTQQSNHL